MAYQSLYRRFRPKNFDEVLGQEHITTTLKNQITSDNVAHAYLFSGTRGTGKTSTAKILARAVNCLDSVDGNPCNECEVCKGIIDDSIMDVIEMDAASNNSVDDVRELREKAKYPPSRGRYKVYIVDEVHMLSKGAFNALLKTLEEPPKHLLFILATTEPQKLPATIQSRCQRFDFKRIGTKDIVKNMMDICRQIEISADDRALNLIARNCDGAMRDALSILDQCVSFVDRHIDHDIVLSILGAVNNDIFFEVTDTVINKDIDKVLGLIDQLIQNGKDVHQFIKDLILHFRNLMIVKTSENVENIIDGSDEMINQLKIQADSLTLANIIRCLNILSEAENQSKWSSQPRIILELSVVKLISPKEDLTVEGLVHKINELEKSLSEGRFVQGNVLSSTTSDTTQKHKAENPEPKQEVKPNVTKNKKEAPISEVTATSVSGPSSLEDFTKNWEGILKRIKGERISIHALLMEGKVADFKNNIVTISFGEGFGFHKDAIEKKENKEYIEKVISNYFNVSISVKFIMDNESNNQKEDRLSDEFIEKVKDIFGEDIVEVE